MPRQRKFDFTFTHLSKIWKTWTVAAVLYVYSIHKTKVYFEDLRRHMPQTRNIIHQICELMWIHSNSNYWVLQMFHYVVSEVSVEWYCDCLHSPLWVFAKNNYFFVSNFETFEIKIFHWNFLHWLLCHIIEWWVIIILIIIICRYTPLAIGNIKNQRERRSAHDTK